MFICCFYNNKFFVMADCPLCNSQFIEAYQHNEYLIVICPRCYNTLKRFQMHRSFTRFSLFQSELSSTSKKANQILQDFVAQQRKDSKVLLKKGIIDQCFKSLNENIQKTERFSLTTQDTDNMTEGIALNKPTTTKKLLGQCQVKAIIIVSRIEPARQKIIKTKQALKQSAASIKNKYQELKAECRNIRAELPPLGGLAREAKNKIGSFFKLF